MFRITSPSLVRPFIAASRNMPPAASTAPLVASTRYLPVLPMICPAAMLLTTAATSSGVSSEPE